MEQFQFYPWHTQFAQNWLANKDRFAHAWLLLGQAGIGKKAFAIAAARSLLCEQTVNGLACGVCEACRWFNNGNHPDFRLIAPESMLEDKDDGSSSKKKTAPSKEIKIDQVRSCEHWFTMSTHRGGWRVVVLYPAELLNTGSANAILKILEEPPENTIFLLVADATDRVLPTIVSRCRRLLLPNPDIQASTQWLEAQGLRDAKQWLDFTGGAPVKALALSQEKDSPVESWLHDLLDSLANKQMPDLQAIVDRLDKTPVALWLDSLQRFLIDCSLQQAVQQSRYYPSLANQIQLMASKLNAEKLSDTLQWLTEQQHLATHPLNARLFAQSVLQRVALVCLSKK